MPLSELVAEDVLVVDADESAARSSSDVAEDVARRAASSRSREIRAARACSSSAVTALRETEKLNGRIAFECGNSSQVRPATLNLDLEAATVRPKPRFRYPCALSIAGTEMLKSQQIHGMLFELKLQVYPASAFM